MGKNPAFPSGSDGAEGMFFYRTERKVRSDVQANQGELLEAVQGLSRKELRLLIDTLKKKLSLPPEEEEEQEWTIIPSSLTITLTGYKPDADKRAITMLIRYYTYQRTLAKSGGS